MGSLRAKQASYIEVMKAISVGGLQGLTRRDRAMFDYIVESMHRYAAGSVDPNFEGYDADLKLYLPFDETSGQSAFDLSGNGNTGTVTGTALGTDNGVFGKCATFDGTDDRISITDDATLQPEAYTMEAWVRPDVLGAYQAVIWRHSGIANYVASYGLRLTNGNVWQTQSCIASATELATGTTIAVLGTFYHVAGTYDGTNLKIYVNGALEATPAVSGAVDYTAISVYIGRRETGTGAFDLYFKGLIDEARIYSRALTADEIYLHYLAGALKLGLI